MGKQISYHNIVDYDVADPAKVLAQNEGKKTAVNMPFGFSEVEGTRGESAYVFDMGDSYGALVQEGLGTKSLVAQAIYEKTRKSYFGQIAQDTVATFVNDLVSVGATPVVSNAYWSSSSYKWLEDKELTTDFITGWKAACDLSKIVWGGGETQALNGIVKDGVLELAGCAFGVIKDRNRLVTEKKLKPGDAILLVESSGVHANGISLTRKIADELAEGYDTKLKSGKTFGQAILEPTIIYSQMIEDLFNAEVDVHYLSNITGHGWRKIMRATQDFTYKMNIVPEPDELFRFIAENSNSDTREMYGNYNMGAGYAVFVPQTDAKKAVEVIEKSGLKVWQAGIVEAGDKKVVIEPLGIVFEGESLGVR